MSFRAVLGPALGPRSVASVVFSLEAVAFFRRRAASLASRVQNRRGAALQ
jgi:hypothetical protein